MSEKGSGMLLFNPFFIGDEIIVPIGTPYSSLDINLYHEEKVDAEMSVSLDMVMPSLRTPNLLRSIGNTNFVLPASLTFYDEKDQQRIVYLTEELIKINGKDVHYV